MQITPRFHYICKRNKQFFSNRLRSVNITLEYIEKFGKYRNDTIQILTQKFFDKIVSSDKSYRHLKKFCYSCCGIIYINDFSITRLSEMQIFYRKMLDMLDKDEDAFLKEQASWLGMEYDDIEFFLREDSEAYRQRHLNSLRAKLEDCATKNPEMKREYNEKTFRACIYRDLVALLRSSDRALKSDRWASEIKGLEKMQLQKRDSIHI